MNLLVERNGKFAVFLLLSELQTMEYRKNGVLPDDRDFWSFYSKVDNDKYFQIINICKSNTKAILYSRDPHLKGLCHFKLKGDIYKVITREIK